MNSKATSFPVPTSHQEYIELEPLRDQHNKAKLDIVVSTAVGALALTVAGVSILTGGMNQPPEVQAAVDVGLGAFAGAQLPRLKRSVHDIFTTKKTCSRCS
jgi:hypothetical protein